MSGRGRFRLYDVAPLRGKVPSILINNYLDDYENIEIVSFIAGLHMSCGSFDIGVKMSEDVVEKASMDHENIREMSIGVWNLYVLSKVYMEQERFDKAYRALDNAERYWSKDFALYDTTGMYRVRNREDLWLRKAFGYLMQGRRQDFESIIDRVMLSRYEMYNKAYEITGETPIRDMCILDCFEYSSYMCRNMEDLEHAIVFIKTALRYLGKVPIDNEYIQGRMYEKTGELKNAYTCYLRFYLSVRPQFFCDTIVYGTCRSCAYFEPSEGINGECKKRNAAVDMHKSCSEYLGITLKAENI